MDVVGDIRCQRCSSMAIAAHSGWCGMSIDGHSRSQSSVCDMRIDGHCRPQWIVLAVRRLSRCQRRGYPLSWNAVLRLLSYVSKAAIGQHTALLST